MARPPIVPDARFRLASARVAHLATVGADGVPHLVPCCLVVDQLVAYSAVDDKPKATTQLRRLADVAEHPVATLLVDHYDEDWSRLWWVRASGPARVIVTGDEHERAIGLLRAKYPQYRTHRLEAPVLAVDLVSWRSWAARPLDPAG